MNAAGTDLLYARVKELEQALLTSDQHVRELRANEGLPLRVVEASQDCVLVLSIDGYVLSSNPAARHFLPARDGAGDEARGEEKPAVSLWLDLWDGGSGRAAEAALLAAKEGGSGRFQAPRSEFGGDRKWWDVTVVAIPDESGRTERVLSVARDITELRRRQDSLVKSEERLQYVLQGIDVGVWDWDLRTGELFLSERWKEMLGYGNDQIHTAMKSGAPACIRRIFPASSPTSKPQLRATRLPT